MNPPARERAIGARLLGWLDRRYDLRPLIDFARHKEVPVGVHSMLWYYLGGTTLFFFVIQIVSGVLLLAYYQPGEDSAYESIRFITTKVPFGWLVRAVHAWSAHLMVLSLLVHMYSTLFLKAYRRPRELTWVTGVLLLAVTLGFGFSGYLLPWNELAFFATAVGTSVVHSVPLVGDWMLHVLRGGPEVTGDTLYRFFALHVVVLPLAAVALLALHLLFIQRQGMAPPVGRTRPPRGIRFFPDFAVRDLLIWLLALILLATLAVLLPYGPGIPGAEWELGDKADPAVAAPAGIRPEWYFLWMFQLLKEFPPRLLGVEGPKLAVAAITVLVLVWLVLPWLDRRGRRNRPSPAFTDLGMAALIFVGYLTAKAWVPDTAADGPAALVPAASILVIAVATGLLRALSLGHRYFVLSAAAALHAALDGFTGLPYVAAGAIAATTAVAGAALLRRAPEEGP